jgi:hypothetical protein
MATRLLAAQVKPFRTSGSLFFRDLLGITQTY